ncbi:MAG: hypothetical protein HUU54_06920, partial [Ignavibacteriaceae bacterium]|nr:hypothetical protein [Ignavibacteriaceae bacterium]
MKKVLLLIIFCSVYLYSASGIWQTYVVISLNGGGNSFYAGSTNPDNGTRWDAVNLGTITSTTTLVLKGGEVKTFKNGGSDVTGAKLFYRVYKDGNTPGSYSDMTLPWVQDLGGGDQKWQRTDGTVDLQDQMTSEGTWKIEIYWEAYTNIDGTHQNTGGGLKSVTGDNSLPVELISFSIKVVNNNIALNWQTATEINNFGFEVERSTDKSNWSKIGFVQGAGNSNSPKNYSYTDNTAVSGKYFYRLKQVDTDGTFDYSPVVEVDMGILPGGYRLEQNYPNPFNPSTSIKFAFSKDTKAAIKVYNALGVEVREIYNGIAEA